MHSTGHLIVLLSEAEASRINMVDCALIVMLEIYDGEVVLGLNGFHMTFGTHSTSKLNKAVKKQSVSPCRANTLNPVEITLFIPNS